MAQILFRRYGHRYAFEDALSGTYIEPETTIPDGYPWTPPTREESSMTLQDDRKRGKNKSTGSKKKNQTMLKVNCHLSKVTCLLRSRVGLCMMQPYQERSSTPLQTVM
jgi:hypothetical protein